MEDGHDDQCQQGGGCHEQEHVGGLGFDSGLDARQGMGAESFVGHEPAIDGHADGGRGVHHQVSDADASPVLIHRQGGWEGVVERRVGHGDAGDEDRGQRGQDPEARGEQEGRSGRPGDHEQGGQNQHGHASHGIQDGPGQAAHQGGHDVDDGQAEGDLAQGDPVDLFADHIVYGHAGEVEEVEDEKGQQNSHVGAVGHEPAAQEGVGALPDIDCEDQDQGGQHSQHPCGGEGEVDGYDPGDQGEQGDAEDVDPLALDAGVRGVLEHRGNQEDGDQRHKEEVAPVDGGDQSAGEDAHGRGGVVDGVEDAQVEGALLVAQILHGHHQEDRAGHLAACRLDHPGDQHRPEVGGAQEAQEAADDQRAHSEYGHLSGGDVVAEGPVEHADHAQDDAGQGADQRGVGGHPQGVAHVLEDQVEGLDHQGAQQEDGQKGGQSALDAALATVIGGFDGFGWT